MQKIHTKSGQVFRDFFKNHSNDHNIAKEFRQKHSNGSIEFYTKFVFVLYHFEHKCIDDTDLSNEIKLKTAYGSIELKNVIKLIILKNVINNNCFTIFRDHTISK